MENIPPSSEGDASLDRIVRDTNPVATEVNALIQTGWLSSIGYKTTWQEPIKHTLNFRTPISDIIDFPEVQEIQKRQGFDSLIKISDKICLAEKNWKYTLTDTSGIIVPLTYPRHPSETRWFKSYFDSGDGIVFVDTKIPFVQRYLRFSKLDANYTGIRNMSGIDITPRIKDIRSINIGSWVAIKIRKSMLSPWMVWRVNSQWIYENLEFLKDTMWE